MQNAASTRAGWIDHAIQQRRVQRFQQLLRFFPAHRPLRILDVGGTVEYWRGVDWSSLRPCSIELLNLDKSSTDDPAMTSVIGDARDLSLYSDRSFDVVFAHSVVGHVGTFADQAQMVRELLRVGQVCIVQTPNHAFPVDWRTRVPGFHWLPPRVQSWCFQHFALGIYPKAPDSATAWEWATQIHDLTPRTLHQLLPSATIYRERVGGFTKSLIAVTVSPVRS
jgi:hypothetical protein